MIQMSRYKRPGVANTYLPRAMHSEGVSDSKLSKLVGFNHALPETLNMKRGSTFLEKIPNKLAISCKESRIETNTSFYGCFYLGPFEQGESVTIANALRRTLLADLMGVAITSVEIEGAVHEYTSITGVRESVLDILLNLKEIILKQTTLSSSITFTPQGQTMPLADSDSILTPPLLTHPRATKANPKGVVVRKSKVNYLERKKKGWGNQVGYLRVRGPGVIRASDLKLPPYITCVDPEQYIATLSDDGVLNMKFFISEGKNYLIQVPNKNLDLNELKKRRLFQKKMKQGNYPKPLEGLLGQLPFNQPPLGVVGVGTVGVRNSFVRYAPLETTSDSLPLRNPTVGRPDSTIANSKGLVGVKSFFNLSGSAKQKKVFNEASNGNRLPIDAVFMPVTKVNYIIEPDEQSNDEQPNQGNYPANKSKSDSTYGSKALSEDSGGSTAIETTSPSLPFRFLPLTPEELIAEFQNLGLKKRSEEEQRAFSNLLVNPLLKTQPPSLFLKHPFNGGIKMLTPTESTPTPTVGREATSTGLKGKGLKGKGSKTALLPAVDILETHNRKGPSYSNEQSQGVDASSSPSFATTPTLFNPTPIGGKRGLIGKGLKKGSLRLLSKKGSSDVNFTFLHPAPFLSLQDKQHMNATLNGSCETKSQEEGQQVIFKDKKQQELLFLPTVGESLPLLPTYGKGSKGAAPTTFATGSNMHTTFGTCVAKEQVVGQEVFTKKHPLKFKIILEIWTNGSIHPRKALYDSFKSMITLFSRLQKVRILGSMLKSERFYTKLIESKFNTEKVLLASQSTLPSKKNLISSTPTVATLTTGTEGSRLKGKGLDSSLPFNLDAENMQVGSVTGGNVSQANSSSVQNANPLFKPRLGIVSGGTKIKSKGLYSLNKTVTGLQTYLPAAATEATPTVATPTGLKGTGVKGSILPTDYPKGVRERLGDNCGESGGHKLPLPLLPQRGTGTKGQLDLITIESLNLSLRSYTCLKRSNINTINDLIGHSKKQLIQIKNFGLHSLEEIQTCLGGLGLKLN